MLSRLMVRLGVEEAKARTIVTEQASPNRATLELRSDGGAILHVQDDFDRAWRRIGLALDRSGFVVEDRDRTQGVYFVRYGTLRVDNSQESPGLLSKLAFWRSDKSKMVGERLPRPSGTSGRRVARLHPDQGGGEARGETRRILTVLQEQLR